MKNYNMVKIGGKWKNVNRLAKNLDKLNKEDKITVLQHIIDYLIDKGGQGYKIRIMDYLKAMGYLAILAALALTANLIFGYNFMFLMELPFELTWVEALGGFPLYTIVFSIVAMLMSFALYLPWIRSEILERKKQKG